MYLYVHLHFRLVQLEVVDEYGTTAVFHHVNYDL